MKRKLWMAVLTMVTLFALVFGIAACGKTESKDPKQLDTPVVHISKDGLASWDADENAKGYVYKINDGIATPTQETSKQLKDGESISVKAIAKDGYANSEFSTPQKYTATTQQDPPPDDHTEHTYGDPVWKWTKSETEGYTATAEFSCEGCTDVQSVPATVTSSTTKEAKCEEDGEMLYTATVTFQDEPYTDEKEATITKLGHDLKGVAKKDATCTEPGYEAYSKCSRCEYKEGYQAINAKGHTYTLTKWEWTGDNINGYTSAKAIFTCGRDSSHTHEEEATITTGEEPTDCVLYTVYTATVTVDFGERSYSMTQKLEQGTSHHSFGTFHEKVPATCNTDGKQAYQQCTRCQLYFDEAGEWIADYEEDLIITKNPADITMHNWGNEEKKVPATCSQEGVESYSQCQWCNRYLHVDEEEKATIYDNLGALAIEKDPNAHEFSENAWVEEVPATCAATGTKAHKQCDLCKKNYDANGGLINNLTIEIDPNAHVGYTHHAEKYATCEEDGNEEYYECTGCHKFFLDETLNPDEERDEEDVLRPATGHAYSYEVTLTPTEENDGTAVMTCANANCEKKTVNVTLPVLGNSNYKKTDDTATCTAPGEIEYTITLTEGTFKFKVTTEKLAHSYVWTFDEKEHWLECEYCEDINFESVGDHTSWSDWESKDNVEHTRHTTCTDHADNQYTEIVAHNYDNGVCGDCSYQHVHGDALEKDHDDTDHWENCDVCGYLFMEKHTFDKDGFCKCDAMNLNGATVTFVAKDKGYANEQDVTSVEEKGDIKITFNKGSGSNGSKYYNTGEAVRIYYGNTVTISAPKGYNIKQITLTFSTGDNGNTITANCGIYANNVWTGTAQAVTFTVGVNSSGETKGNRRLAKIEIVFEKECAHAVLNPVERKEATCEEAGYEAYWQCERCKKMFDSDKAEHEISAPTEIEKSKHEYGEWTPVEGGVYHTGTCTLCHNSTTTEAHEYGGGDTCVKCKYENKLTPEQKAQAALDALEIPETLEGDFTLTTDVDGVKFHVEVIGGQGAIEFDEATQTLKVTRGSAEVTAQLKVTASCDGQTTSKEKPFGVKVPAALHGSYEITVNQFTGLGSGYAQGTWSVTDTNGAISGYGRAIKASGNNTGKMQFNGSSGNYILSTTPTPAAITKVILKGSSRPTQWKLLTSSTAFTVPGKDDKAVTIPDSAVAGTVSGSDVTWTLTGSDTYFELLLSGSNADYPESIVITYGVDTTGGGTTTPEPHTCTDKCPTCQQCTNNSCQDAACLPKCSGHSGTENPGTTGGTATFTPAKMESGVADGTNIDGKTYKDGSISLSIAKQTGTAPAFYAAGIRIYRYNTLTFTADTGYVITGITVKITSTSYKGDFGTPGFTYNGTTGTWSGSAGSLVFTNNVSQNTQFRFTEITVTYTATN